MSLLVTDEQISLQHERAKHDLELAQVAVLLQKSADRLLNDPPLERKLVGPRLLAVSRFCGAEHLAALRTYRWTGDRKYLISP